MIRLLAVAAAAAVPLTLASAAGFAQAPRTGYYAATPAAAPTRSTLVTRSTVWKCGDGVCTAAKANTRDAIMCELVAREIGQLAAFQANGAPFDAGALAKCNTKARPST